MEDEVITPLMKSKLGKEEEVFSFKIDEGLIERVTDSVEDYNPLWRDSEYASKSRYGGTIAPWYLVPVITKYPEVTIDKNIMDCPLKNELNGGTEIDFLSPIRPGDVITRKDKLLDIFTKVGKRQGKMVFEVWERNFRNQREELVVKIKQTTILY